MIIRQRVLPNARLNDNVGIWEGSIVYEVLYLVFKAKAIVLRFQVGGMGLGMGVRPRGLMKPLEHRLSYACVGAIPRSENSWRAFFG